MKITPQYAASIRCELPPGAQDHTGKTRERLTFLWPTTERDGCLVRWVALCSCGNYALASRRARSCGCLCAKVGTRGHLSPDAVFDIRSSDKPRKELAAHYGVSEPTIANIRGLRRYGHL
jgi:hypothetical protein